MDEQERLIDIRERSPQESENNESSVEEEEEWSDSTSTSSYYSDTDSSLPDWESSIDPHGQLIYIDCHPFLKSNPPETDPKSTTSHIIRNTKNRKSTRSKFLRLIRRRDSKRKSSKRNKTADFNTTENPSTNNTNSTSKVTFSDYQEGETRIVTLAVERGTSVGKLGRRVSLVEAMLGLNVSTFTDGNRIMVAGFAVDSDASKEKNIKIGDWMKTINGIQVNIYNVNSVLEQLDGNSVQIQLQRVAGVEVTKSPPTNELSTQSPFVAKFLEYSPEIDQEFMTYLSQQPMGILYLNTDDLTETGDEFDGVIYSYPYPFNANNLCQSRGIFITLNNLVNSIVNSRPKVTNILQNNKAASVSYKTFGADLLLLMMPEELVCLSSENILLIDELTRVLEFVYQSVARCFASVEKKELDHFFSRFFESKVNSVGLRRVMVDFEDVLPMGKLISLPGEAELQIDDALSELEASDYREWNEDPLDCQRLFTILGSALYHSGYLLATHLIQSDLIDIHGYLRQIGLFHLTKNEPVKSIVLWREVFPLSCNNRGLTTNENMEFHPPDKARRYLLIVGTDKDLLAVLMEAGGCTEPALENLGPDVFYVEEAQATLAHLRELGITELAAKWIRTNPGVQIKIPTVLSTGNDANSGNSARGRAVDFLTGTSGNTGMPFAKSSGDGKVNQSVLGGTMKKPEVTSILKRRGSDLANTTSGAASPYFSVPETGNTSELLQSDDSVSQGGYSELSDEPVVVGRRATREKGTGRNPEHSDEDSDIDDYRDGSQLSNSSYDLTELRHSLLSETAGLQPLKLTVGYDNVLFHYVHLDSTEGVLLSPPNCTNNSEILKNILSNFNRCCHDIHGMFQNTLRFKKLPSQEMAKSVMNKSLIAIKEYGMLFEYSCLEENAKKASKMSYWVVGRLFLIPYPREMFVCYQDTIPQNLIEIAFKLGISHNI